MSDISVTKEQIQLASLWSNSKDESFNKQLAQYAKLCVVEAESNQIKRLENFLEKTGHLHNEPLIIIRPTKEELEAAKNFCENRPKAVDLTEFNKGVFLMEHLLMAQYAKHLTSELENTLEQRDEELLLMTRMYNDSQQLFAKKDARIAELEKALEQRDFGVVEENFDSGYFYRLSQKAEEPTIMTTEELVLSQLSNEWKEYDDLDAIPNIDATLSRLGSAGKIEWEHKSEIGKTFYRLKQVPIEQKPAKESQAPHIYPKTLQQVLENAEMAFDGAEIFITDQSGSQVDLIRSLIAQFKLVSDAIRREPLPTMSPALREAIDEAEKWRDDNKGADFTKLDGVDAKSLLINIIEAAKGIEPSVVYRERVPVELIEKYNEMVKVYEIGNDYAGQFGDLLHNLKHIIRAYPTIQPISKEEQAVIKEVIKWYNSGNDFLPVENAIENYVSSKNSSK